MTRKFALQRVLDFKEQVEDLLKLEVAAIEGRRLDIQHTLDTLRRRWEESSAAPPPRKLEPIDPALVEAASDYRAVLDQHIKESDEWLEQVHQELESKRDELTTAYQEGEMLRRLKERRTAEQLKAEQRRDARSMEEIATSQHLRRVSDPDDPGGTKANGSR